MVKATPGTAFVMVQSQFFLHLLIALFHGPAAPPQADCAESTGGRRQVAEGVLDGAVGLLLDQQPLRRGADALTGRPSAGRPNPQPGEAT